MSNKLTGSAAHDLQVLFGIGRIGARSDPELVRLFLSGSADEAECAFGALVERHGRMVLHVCRQVLHDGHDAEDAFQVVFMVLARKARALHADTPLGPWLHEVALRTAFRARADVARRLRHEGRAAELAVGSVNDRIPDDSGEILQEELSRLPTKYRLPIVLCYLEGLTDRQAAQQLGWPPGTVRSRLARGRERLRTRLTRRGLVPSIVAVAAALTPDAAWSAVSPSLVDATSRTAVIVRSGKTLTGLVSPTILALFDGVLAAMAITRLKAVAVSLLIVAASAAGGLAVLGIGMSRAMTSQPAQQEPLDRAPPQSDVSAAAIDLAVKGVVVSPDGKPVPDARLYLLDYPRNDARTTARSASDQQGRFSFRVPGNDVGLNQPHNWNVPWTSMYVMASADGYAPAVAHSPRPGVDRDLTLRLLYDSVPIKGRVLNLEGKPVSGATLRVTELAVPDGALADWIEAAKSNQWSGTIDSPRLESLFPPVTTGEDGRFELTGIGAGRVAVLTLHGPGLETARLAVATGPSKLVYIPDPWSRMAQATLPCYGSEFEHPAAPSRPVVGVVRDADTKKPLAGFTIAGPQDRTVTDAEGRFRLCGMPRKGGPVVVAPPGNDAYLPVERIVPERSGVDAETLDFDLKRGILVKGRVTDQETGQPVFGEVTYVACLDNPNRDGAASLPVRVNGQGSRFGTSPIGKDGSYQIVVVPGRGIITAELWGNRYLVGVGASEIKGAEKNGLFPAVPFNIDPRGYNRLVEINPGDDDRFVTCNLAVDPGRTVAGVLQGPDGKPLTGALAFGLRFNDHGPYWEPSDDPLPTDAFTVYGIRKGERRKIIFLHTERHLAASMILTGEEKSSITVELEPWGTVTGRLVDASATPHSGLALGFAYGAYTPPDQGTHPEIFQTDGDGKFRVEGLVPGMKYTLGTLDAASGLIAAAAFENLVLKSGETRDLGNLRLGTPGPSGRPRP